MRFATRSFLPTFNGSPISPTSSYNSPWTFPSRHLPSTFSTLARDLNHPSQAAASVSRIRCALLESKSVGERYFVHVYLREDDCFQVQTINVDDHSRQTVNVLIFCAKALACNICSRSSRFRLSTFNNDHDGHSSPPLPPVLFDPTRIRAFPQPLPEICPDRPAATSPPLLSFRTS